MAEMDWLVLFCGSLVLIGPGFKAFFKGVLAVFLVHAAYFYLLRHGVCRDARKALGETPATLIPISSIPPAHPFFRLRMVSYAVEANSRNRLLNLPAELRNKIYEHALYIGEVQLVKITEPATTPPTVLNLLQTCHHIHNEAEGILFTVNKLCLAEDDFHGYFKRCSPTRSETRYKYIKELTVLAKSPLNIVHLLASTSELRNLRNLVVDVSEIPYEQVRNILTPGRGDAQRWINVLPNLMRLSIHTPAYWMHFSISRAISADLQAMIDHRDKVLAKLDTRKRRG